MKFTAMKNLLHFIVLIGLLAGCDYVDVPTPANGPPPPPSATRHRKVLVEEVTGHHCPTCPAGALALEGAKSVYGDSMILIAVHTGYFAETSPPHGVPPSITTPGAFARDFNTPEGNDFDLIYNLSGAPPISMVNRLKFPISSHQIPPTDVATVLDTLLNRPQVADFVITHNYNTSTRALDLTVNGNFLTAIGQTGQNINVVAMITEDGIVDWQQNSTAPGGAVQFYTFKHVLRACVNTPGSVAGSLIHSGAAVAGDTLLYALPSSYTVNSAYNAANCHLVVYVYNTITKEVLQAEEVELVE